MSCEKETAILTMRKIKSGVGNEFAHCLFTHLIGPSGEGERKRNRIEEWKAEEKERFSP